MLKQSAWNSARQVTSILSGSGTWVWITCGSGPDDWLGRVPAYRAVTSFENSDALPCGLVTVDENYIASARKARVVVLHRRVSLLLKHRHTLCSPVILSRSWPAVANRTRRRRLRCMRCTAVVAAVSADVSACYFFKSAAIAANCERAASKSSTMEFTGVADMDGKPGG